MRGRWRHLWALRRDLWVIYAIPVIAALVTALAAEWLLGRAGW